MIKKITFIVLLLTATISFSQTTVNSENFESGSFSGTQWNSGGANCDLANGVPPNNNYAVRLLNGGSSSAYTVYSNAFDLSSYGSVDVSFDFQTSGYTGTDDFYLEYSTNGTNWTKVGDFNINNAGVQFTDNTKYTAQKVTITASLNATTSFRFRCSATSSPDYLYIDNILIEGNAPDPILPTVGGIPANAVWRYLDDGSNQGTAWRASSFDDSSWSYGPAELGYGDGEATTVGYGGNSSNKYPTTYFRKEFTIADKSIFNSIDLEAIRDDGMVVYLNGTEVWRDHITGTVDYSTLADSPAIGGADESTWITTNIASTLLVDGSNTIAVEIHQQSVTSSDISFNFKLTPSATAVGAPSVVRGPYLQTGTPTSVIVKWRTDNPTDSKVNYGTSLGSLSASVSDATLTTEHEVTITSLSPNTKYFYDIADGSNTLVSESAEMYVITAPPVGTKQFVRAWALGDAGTGNSNQMAVRDQYYSYVSTASKNPGKTDMMLFLGDNAYNSGYDSEYQSALFNIYTSMLKKSVAWSCLGNHETYSVGGASNASNSPYYDIFTFPTNAEAGGTASGTEQYYSFDYANIHFIVLESMSLYNDTNQINWVTSDIQSTSQDWIIAFFHHPPYTKGSHNSDTETELMAMRANFLNILEANGVDLVLNGHSHSYERSFFIDGHYGLSGTFTNANKVQTGDGKLDGNGAYLKTTSSHGGAVYVVTGSAGKISGGSLNHPAMFTSLNQLGSSVIEIDGDGLGGQNLTLKFLNDSGAFNDYFTINKSSSVLSTDAYEIDNKQIKIFPVPSNSFLNIAINTTEELKKVKIFNAIGTLVKESKNKQINVKTLSKGMYMVIIETTKNSYYKTILIE